MNTAVRRRGIVLSPTDLRFEGWIDLCREAGLNLVSLHSDFPTLCRWHRSSGGRSFRRALARADIDLEFAIHFTPSFMTEKRFREHPDWFPTDICGNRYWEGANPCTHSPALLEFFTGKAIEAARALPASTHRYHLWAADNRPWCNCPECASFSPSEQNLRLMHALLEGLRSWDRQAKLSYLAYMESFAPPVRIRPQPGIYLEYAPYRRNHRVALGTPDCRANADHLEALRNQLTVFRAAETRVLDYWLDVSLFSAYRRDRAPVEVNPAPGVMERDIVSYASLGIREITTFACWMNASYFRNYPHAREVMLRYGHALQG